MRILRHVQKNRCFSTQHGITLKSSGVIFDPYKIVTKDDTPGLFSSEGVQYRMQSAKSTLYSSYCSAFIQKHIPGFNHHAFTKESEKIFENFIDGHRKGDINLLRSVVTQGLLDGIQKEVNEQQKKQQELYNLSIKKKNMNKNKNITNKKIKKTLSPHALDIEPVLRKTFTLESFARPPRVLQMRYGFIGNSRKSKDNGYGQITVLLNSIRNVVQVDITGTTMIGEDNDNEKIQIKVPSVVVFEVGFNDPSVVWRIARIEEVGEVDQNGKMVQYHTSSDTSN